MTSPSLLEGVGDPLDALAGEAPRARDLRDRQRLPLDRGEDAPAGGRLAGGAREGVAGCRERAVEPEDLHDEPAQCVAGRRAGYIDSMLSFCYLRRMTTAYCQIGEEW